VKGTNHISRVASDFYFITMEIIIDNKKIIVESAKWRTEHEKYYSISGNFYGVAFDLDYVDITIHNNFIKDLLFLLIERNEHKIEFDGKVANFYLPFRYFEKLFNEIKVGNNEFFEVGFVGTMNEVGE
jgi:hypothetical protein